MTTDVHDLPTGALNDELLPTGAARVYALRLADVATPEAALGFLASACGCGGDDLAPADWYDDARVAALAARIGAALAAQGAALVLDRTGERDDDPRWAACWSAIGGHARVITVHAPSRDDEDVASLAPLSIDDRVLAIAARWRRAPAGDPWQRGAALTRLVRVALRVGAAEWAAEVLVGPSTARLHDAQTALIARLAGDVLAAGAPTPLHGAVLAGLRATHLFQADRTDDAIALFRSAVELARETDEPRLVCHALGNLGNALAAIEPAAAEPCFGEAIELARAAELVDEELINLNNLCVTLMDAGELDRAGETFDFAIRRVDETRRWRTFGNVIVGNLGTLYGRTEHWQMASAFLRRAMDVAVEDGDTALWSSWLTNLIDVLRAGGADAFDAELLAYADAQQRRAAARPS
jgi:tetratricopeptide (TPR) repeat protein